MNQGDQVVRYPDLAGFAASTCKEGDLVFARKFFSNF
jgi:hypothetical protein